MKSPFKDKDSIKRLQFIIHPLLFAVFPALFLYSANIIETAADQVYLPLLLSVAGTAVLFALLMLITRDVVKAGIATTLFVLLFFSYGRLYEALENWGVWVPAHYHLLPVMVFIWGYCVYFIKLIKWDFINAAKVLNVVAVVLVAINLVNIGWYQVKTAVADSGDKQTVEEQAANVNGIDLENMPDIYYIILDEYAHPDTMLEYYDYDNSEFIEYLEDKGFYWASESRTRTLDSFKSIATTLNMNYIHENESTEEVYSKLEDNEVSKILKSNGYRFVYFGNWYDETRYNFNADIYYNFYNSDGVSNLTTDYSKTFWNTTILDPFYESLVNNEFNTYWRSGITGVLNGLGKLTSDSTPKFVFAHIMCPHDPFVFKSDGGFVEPLNWTNWENEKYYLGQYKYITNQIIIVINSWSNDSQTKPIIIIQSDHGIRTHHTGVMVGENEWSKILNVYHLPDGGNELLYENISPANTFRLIFNYYFNYDYIFLDD